MGIEKQGSKPAGMTGYFIGRLMNMFHTGFYKKYYSKELPDSPVTILDIGCGGGSLIKYLSTNNSNYRLYGIDHSEEMVAMSRRINKDTVKNGRASIDYASAGNLPYDSETMDIVTANETVQFWPDTSESFSEIFRVLRNGGCFYIINRFPAEGSTWWRIAKLKTENDFTTAYENAGFTNIETDLEIKRGWIIAKAIKLTDSLSTF